MQNRGIQMDRGRRTRKLRSRNEQLESRLALKPRTNRDKASSEKSELRKLRAENREKKSSWPAEAKAASRLTQRELESVCTPKKAWEVQENSSVHAYHVTVSDWAHTTVTSRGQILVRRVCVLQRLQEPMYSLADLYLLSETQIELIVVKTLLWKHNREAITEGWTRRRNPAVLRELLIKIVVFICFPVMFSLTASVSVYFAILSIRCIK